MQRELVQQGTTMVGFQPGTDFVIMYIPPSERAADRTSSPERSSPFKYIAGGLHTDSSMLPWSLLPVKWVVLTCVNHLCLRHGARLLLTQVVGYAAEQQPAQLQRSPDDRASQAPSASSARPPSRESSHDSLVEERANTKRVEVTRALVCPPRPPCHIVWVVAQYDPLPLAHCVCHGHGYQLCQL